MTIEPYEFIPDEGEEKPRVRRIQVDGIPSRWRSGNVARDFFDLFDDDDEESMQIEKQFRWMPALGCVTCLNRYGMYQPQNWHFCFDHTFTPQEEVRYI